MAKARPRPASRKPASGSSCELFVIVHNASLTAEIKDALAACGMGYTVVESVHGQGRSGKRFGDEVFPGINHMLLVAAPPKTAGALRSRLVAIASANPGVGLKILAIAAKDLL